MGHSKSRVGPTEASSGRLLVLEVAVNHDAKVLRTVDLISRKQMSIALCEDWIDSDVRPGDVVRVILTHEDGTFETWDENASQEGIPLLVTNDLHFFVHHADTLVSATSVADSLKCLRKAVLACRTPSGMPAESAAASEAAVFGNLIHDLFQIILASDSNTRDYSSPECISQTGGVDIESFFEAVEEVLYRNYESLYAAKILDQNARRVLHEVIPDIMEWYKIFMGSGNHMNTIGGLLRDGKSSHRVVVREVHDIEELMWSPVLGLKGKIDASVQLRVDEADTGVGVFELKTGNSLGYSSVSHSAQTALYTLLMSDRNSRFLKHGLLTYIQYKEALKSIIPEKNVDSSSNQDSSVSKSRATKTLQGAQKNRVVIPVRGELLALTMQRNRLATFLRPGAAIDDLPPLLQGRPEVCSKCFVSGSCMLQYKQLEHGPVRNLSAGPGIDLFKEKTAHLSKEHEEYYRFWRSVLADEEEHAGRSSRELWSKEGRKREAEGECLSNLLLKPSESSNSISPHQLLTLGDRVCSTFMRHPKTNLIGDLSKTRVAKGDYVVVSAERAITDKEGFVGSYSSTFTWQCGLTNGFVSRVDSETISVLVGRSLSAWTLHQGLNLSEVVWRIDCEEIYSSHTTSKRTIENLFCNGENKITTRLRQLIVDGKAPELDEADLVQSGSANNKNSLLSLNADQQRAVEMSLRAKDYLLILGMPGTGKTTTLAAIVLAFASRDKSVLLCSHTNTAVDNLLVKLLDLGFNDFLRLGRNLDVIDKRVHDNHVSKICKPGIGTKQLEKDLDAPRVLATTCLGINHAVLARRTEFDLVVVDEASQILQPICIGPLQFAGGAFILVGDHYQLPPLQRSSGGNRRSASRLMNKKRRSTKEEAPELEEVVAAPTVTENESLFRRLCIKHPEAMVSLTLQYRMGGQIMSLSNELVYCGNLQCATKAVEMQTLHISGEGIRSMLPWLRAVRDPSKTIIFLDTSEMEAKDERQSNGVRGTKRPRSNRRVTDKAERENESEIDTVVESVRCLMEAGVALSDITVLSPFRAQVHLMRESLAENFDSGDSLGGRRPCQVFTIDQYQGKDNRCVMVSFVRGRMDPVGPLLQDWRRINVAITRAKQKLILIGCANTLARGSSFLGAMIAWLRMRNLLYMVSVLPAEGYKGKNS